MSITRSFARDRPSSYLLEGNRSFVATLACCVSLLTGCVTTVRVENPATLINWYQKRIDDKTFLQLKPALSYIEFDDCTAGILKKPPTAPIDLAYPRFTEPNDLTPFGGKFPQYNVSVFKSSRVSFAEVESAIDILIREGTASPSYSTYLKNDEANIRQVRLPLTPGTLTVHTFARYLADVSLNIAANRATLRVSGVNFSIPDGTGSIVRHDGRLSLITAAHVLTELKGRKDRDLAILSHKALDVRNIPPDELYISSLHPTIRSADLKGKPLQIYFHRTACTEEKRVGRSLVYSLTPTVYDEERDELYANSPADFGDYMGGVSGAGVYLDGKIVGVFLGRRCAEGLPDGDCSGAEGKTAFLRFVGIDSLRLALKLSTEAGAQFPLVLY